MAASQAIDSFGAEFQYETTIGGGTYTTFSEVTSVEGGGKKWSKIDLTHLKSDNKYKEQKPGFGEGDDVKLTLNFLKAQLTTLEGLAPSSSSDNIRSFRVSFASVGTLTFQGWIMELGFPKLEVDNKLEQEVTFAITGKPVWAAL